MDNNHRKQSFITLFHTISRAKRGVTVISIIVLYFLLLPSFAVHALPTAFFPLRVSTPHASQGRILDGGGFLQNNCLYQLVSLLPIVFSLFPIQQHFYILPLFYVVKILIKCILQYSISLPI